MQDWTPLNPQLSHVAPRMCPVKHGHPLVNRLGWRAKPCDELSEQQGAPRGTVCRPTGEWICPGTYQPLPHCLVGQPLEAKASGASLRMKHALGTGMKARAGIPTSTTLRQPPATSIAETARLNPILSRS